MELKNNQILGGICKNGHRYNDTDFSLRYKTTEGGPGHCVRCKELVTEERRRMKEANRPTVKEGFKICHSCKSELPFESFHSWKSSKHGLSGTCKSCIARQKKTLYQKYGKPKYVPGSSSARGKKRQQEKWMLVIAETAKASARRRQLSYEINESTIVELWEKQSGRCHWFGIQMGDGSYPAKHPQKVSIDRLDTNKGYIPGNVVLCCFFANMGRHTNSQETFAEFIQKVFRANQQ